MWLSLLIPKKKLVSLTMEHSTKSYTYPLKIKFNFFFTSNNIKTVKILFF